MCGHSGGVFQSQNDGTPELAVEGPQKDQIKKDRASLRGNGSSVVVELTAQEIEAIEALTSLSPVEPERERLEQIRGRLGSSDGYVLLTLPPCCWHFSAYHPSAT